jgi:hypothetical protein
MNRFILALVAAAALTGCSVPKANVDPNLTAAGEIVLRIAIRHGIADYIDKHGPGAAIRAKALVDDLLVVVNSDSETTLGALKELAYSKIPAEFSPMDQADARDVINLVAAAIQQRVGEGKLNGDAIVKLRDALEWISQAASLAGAGP